MKPRDIVLEVVARVNNYRRKPFGIEVCMRSIGVDATGLQWLSRDEVAECPAYESGRREARLCDLQARLPRGHLKVHFLDLIQVQIVCKKASSKTFCQKMCECAISQTYQLLNAWPYGSYPAHCRHETHVSRLINQFCFKVLILLE